MGKGTRVDKFERNLRLQWKANYNAHQVQTRACGTYLDLITISTAASSL